ncbi:XRE family transcriptional regulator [Glutamicibacter arilaitensis]|uniref:XRE family transcriptional regulator n=1 Tax=Glutamicibacter arilaitensis TaxID=256701 RepID=A0A4Y8U217_9MICC|nr:XRE family transcriptional regulator [Glutamicibacter arilaitensis]
MTTSVTTVIARLRREAGLTLEELADKAGLHRTSLGLVERGERGLTLDSAAKIADALDTTLGALIAVAEASEEGVSSDETSLSPRRLPSSVSMNEETLLTLTGLPASAIRSAVEYVYDTLDIIDAELIARGSEPISGLVELANLSSMIGNLVGAGVAESSNDLYVRNRPHAFPDLVPQSAGLPDLEIKTALESNSPKGHLPKEGVYLTFRYCLGGPNGEYIRGKTNRGRTAWIWEVRVGYLGIEDFAISNTDGDSGKTAVIKTDAFKSMAVVFFDERFFPYARAWGGLRPMGTLHA